MTAVDELGYVAASLVLATFCAKSMVHLRVLAIASNLAFIAYGYFAGLWPILVLHSVMLPLNIVRLREALATVSLRPDPSANIGFAVIPAAWRSPLLAQRIFSRVGLRAQFSKAKALATPDLDSDQVPCRQPAAQQKKGEIDALCNFASRFSVAPFV